LQGGLHRFDPATGAFTLICPVESNLPGNRLNDGAVDAAGRLWFGTMEDAEENATGNFYCFERGRLRLADSGYYVCNGPAFSPDGKTLYHTDSGRKENYAFDLNADGMLANKRVFTTLEDGAGYPDGSVVDAAGFVWTALWRGWGIRRYAPDGRLAETISLPVALVTKIAFGGDDLRDVYVTSAWNGLSEEERAAQPLAGGVFHFRSDTPGQTQNAVLL
jgi:sugar lactone lactonase YvrE